jgi:hypothetical protein
MRKIFYLLVFLPFLAKAQLHPIQGHPIQMEYWKGAKGADGNLYGWGGLVQNSSAHPLPGSRVINNVGAQFNAFTVTATDGTLWYSGFYNSGGMNTWTQFTTDTTNASITDAALVWGYQSTYFFTRANGSLWMGGNDYCQILGTSGATRRPIQISPGGVVISKLTITGGPGSKWAAFGISSDSLTVYEWASGSGTSPTTLTATGIGTGKFLDAQSNGNNQYGYANFYNIQQTTGSPYGKLYVIGNQSIVMGGSSSSNFNYTTLHNLYADLGFTSLISNMSANEFACMVVDSAHNMWELGGYNSQGTLGIGTEAVNQYTYSNPYSWTFVANETPVYGKQQIGAGHQWKSVWGNGFFVFYWDAYDVNDSIYCWGRNKDDQLAQNYRMDDNDYANHPNCCDLLSPTAAHYQTTTTVPTVAWTAPTWSAGSNQTIGTSSTTITASGSPPLITETSTPFSVLNYTVSSTQWTQVSGPNTATISSPSTLSTSVSGLIQGTYVFQNLETDNNTGTLAASVTVIVTATSGPPTVTASASPNIITLPTSSTNLSGTVTYNGSATGVSTSWTCTVKPGGAGTPTITPGGTLTAPTAAVSGLTTAGTYTFQLSATDSNNATGTNTVNVIVNAATTSCSCLVSPF